MTGKVVFSEIFGRNASGDAIQFLAEHAGRRIVCQISHDTLVRDFGARNATPRETAQAFRTHFALICEMAQRKILASKARKETEIVV
jgi:hypothetical protein